MRTRLALAVLAALLIGGHAQAQSLFDKIQKTIGTVTGTSSGGGTTSGGGLSTADVTVGLREALRVGTERVGTSLGAADGYNADPSIHIPLPPELQKVQNLLKKFGLLALADDVELRLNRAAEAAAPKTEELIWKAIEQMTLDDAMAIYKGPQDAATQYFKKVATGDLTATVKPVVDQSLAQVGALSAYDNLLGQYKAMPFVPDVKSDLSQHAIDLALRGLFAYLAKEEAAIRQDPAKRTTEILTKVFGGT